MLWSTICGLTFKEWDLCSLIVPTILLLSCFMYERVLGLMGFAGHRSCFFIWSPKGLIWLTLHQGHVNNDSRPRGFDTPLGVRTPCSPGKEIPGAKSVGEGGRAQLHITCSHAIFYCVGVEEPGYGLVNDLPRLSSYSGLLNTNQS